MLHHIWALVERLAPRLISAGIVFLLAAWSTPSIVGFYTWGALFYTAALSVSDAAVRQIVVRVEGTHSGDRFLGIYRMFGCIALPILIFCAIGLLGLFTGDWGMALQLWPFAIAPIPLTISIKAVGRLQLAGEWHRLGRSQLYAAAASVLVALPILVVNPAPFAAALQTLVSEATFAISVMLYAMKRTSPDRHDAVGIFSEFRVVAAYSGLSWAQGQADRLLIGVLSGTGVLGIYSLGTAIARSPADPLSAGTANLLRANLIDVAQEDIRAVANQVLKRAVVLASAISFSVSAGTFLVLRPMLGAAWYDALNLVPILALSAIPSALGWSASVLQIAAGRARRAIVVPVVGIAVAPLIAWFSTFSLDLAAIAVLLRDYLVVTTSFMMLGTLAPWRAYGLSCALLLATGACSLGWWILGSAH